MRWTGTIRCEANSVSRKNSEGSLLESMKRELPASLARLANAPSNARALSCSVRDAKELMPVIVARTPRNGLLRSSQDALLHVIRGDIRLKSWSAEVQNVQAASFSPQTH